jgi:hypothetical protein
MATEHTLREQADVAMAKALAAKSSERYVLMEEALRLHRLARAEDLGNDPSNLLTPGPDGDG